MSDLPFEWAVPGCKLGEMLPEHPQGAADHDCHAVRESAGTPPGQQIDPR